MKHNKFATQLQKNEIYMASLGSSKNSIEQNIAKN